MASSGTNPMIYLLCWNRGKKHKEYSKPVWDSYWGTIDPKPDIVFLQEENHAERGSNNLFDEDQREYTKYRNCPEAVVVVKSTIKVANLNFSQFVLDSFVNNANSMKELDESTIKTTLDNVFKFFPDHMDCIKSDFKTSDKVNHASSVDAITLDIINKELKDRICMVPLKVCGTNIIAVSFHAESTIKDSDKVSKITRLFKFLDKLGHSTQCCAIVVGGDFNFDLHDSTKGIDLCGFIVPPYSPTIHRAMHGKGYMCIDFFVYKNFLPNVGVEVKNVCSEMIIKCPGLVKSNQPGEFHISLEQYNNNDSYKRLRITSNHDPLQATLTLVDNTSPSITHLWSSTKFNSSKKRPSLADDEEDENKDKNSDEDGGVKCLQQGVQDVSLGSISNKKPSTQGI